MTRKTATSSSPRKPRLLWANPFCMLDTSSGASMSVREMLHQLAGNGYDIRILGCTIFDDPKGSERLFSQLAGHEIRKHQLIEVPDGKLVHQLLVTQSTARKDLTSKESDTWLTQYVYLLDEFKPDIVWFYGGHSLDMMIPYEARVRGIPSAFYLVNSNYKTPFWCKDIDLILTDSQATADMYKKEIGFHCTPLGKFIDPARFIAEKHERRNLLLVNPTWEKGAGIAIQLALKLEKERPDITLEVVESRSDWSAIQSEVFQIMGINRQPLGNILVTRNTADMRPVYERARVLLAPSLWWESGARVLAEAMLNSIPAIVSNNGGSPSMIKDGGIVFDFPKQCHEPPYRTLLGEEDLKKLTNIIIELFDNESLYQKYVKSAQRVGKENHHISSSTDRLLRALAPLVKQKAGNKDFLFHQGRHHKHRLAGISEKPDIPALKISTGYLPKSDLMKKPQDGAVANYAAAGTPSRSEQVITITADPSPSAEFDWNITGQVVVIDNRASLLRQGAALKLLKTGAFAMLAFDPASEVQNPEQYADNPNLQVFPHALLGNGQPATLHACLDPAMSSVLEPLPGEQLPKALRQGATVLARLPIDTIALDSIEGLPSLDWLVLDALSDTTAVLEHGQQALQHALLIQARTAFQITHQQQCGLQQLRTWADSHGFHFLRLNAPQYSSLFPAVTDCASQLDSAEVLLIPDEARLSRYSIASRKKLAFLLHAVFDARDAACRVLDSIDPALCQAYLREVSQVRPTHQSQAAPRAVQQAVAMEKPLTPDEVLARLLPADSAQEPGSVRWLIEKEQQFGGIHHGVVRSKTSPLDPRSPEQYSAGFVRRGDQLLPTHIGGDRMSLNHHGYSLAYSGYLMPILRKRREERLVIVEIGILRGIGLAIWCDLFPNARVIGFDLDTSNFEGHKPTLEAQGAFRLNQPEVYEFDQFADNRQKIADILGQDKIDIVIDDGAHTLDAIMMTFNSIKKSLAADYVYFIEDFCGIEATLRKLLPGKRIAYRDEMTVIAPNSAEYPKAIPSITEFAQNSAF